MQPSDSKQQERIDLVKKIVPIVVEKGLKSTTMDIVASRLGMSKRTLYEIFGSKDQLLKETLSEIERENHVFVKRAFAESENVMEALIDIFKHNRDRLERVNVNFFRDMDLYKDKRETYEKNGKARHESMLEMFDLGVKQGMFRPDVDYNIQSRIMGIQMESLKRMEQFFPADIKLVRVFDAIIVGFLRSIASEKGMRVLDKLTEDLTK